MESCLAEPPGRRADRCLLTDRRGDEAGEHGARTLVERVGVLHGPPTDVVRQGQRLTRKGEYGTRPLPFQPQLVGTAGVVEGHLPRLDVHLAATLAHGAGAGQRYAQLEQIVRLPSYGPRCAAQDLRASTDQVHVERAEPRAGHRPGGLAHGVRGEATERFVQRLAPQLSSG